MFLVNYFINVSIIIVIVVSIELRSDIDKAKKIKALISRQQHLLESPNANLAKDALGNGVFNPQSDRAVQLRRALHDEDKEDAAISSSFDLPPWREEWQKLFEKRKKEAKDLYNPAEHDGSVNMVAARPWGVRCGDPDQYAVLWGNCMLAQQCAADLRIWRGDSFCGRTELVCCAMQINAYDTIQGMPPSFEDSDMGFGGSEEIEDDDKEKSMLRDKYKKRRINRKEKLKEMIKTTVNKIKRMLKEAYRKITDKKIKQTLLLQKYIKWLKKMHKKDRLSVGDIHELEMIKLDKSLLKKINQLMGINKYANKNDTFREITYNSTITKKMAKLLLRFFPEVESDLNNMTRRGGSPLTPDSSESLGLDELFGDQNNATENKDVEYGILYF